MRILFFSHYFPPEVNAPANRTFEHCRRWAAAGHDVTVVTCVPNCPDGVAYEGYRSRFRQQEEMVDGIRVVRVWTFLARNAKSNRRIANYVSYLVSAVWTALWLKKPDIVVATSPQFFCGWAGVWAARLKRVPFVLEIRDIWPESIAAVGAMRKGKRIRFLKWLERRMYRAASHIVAVGTGYRDQITPKVPEMREQISVIPNGVDGECYRPQHADQDFLDQHGLTDKFVCSYIGTIGMAHGLDVVVRAASRLRQDNRKDIAFLIVGDGATRSALEQQVTEAGVEDYVVFTGRLAKEKIPNVLASSDCCLIHLRATKLFATVIPSKIFETMAMQRPIVMGVRGPAQEIVMEAGGGIPMAPESDAELAQIVTRLADDRDSAVELGREARKYVLEHYNRNDLATAYLELLHRVAKLASDKSSVGVPPDPNKVSRHVIWRRKRKSAERQV
ncbi:MAG: glycosyltransferase family 4 protein [Planctomycetes bacterium]|nr:glycosyltransferase family 4 protein [Planctomycetota bacterium]